MPGGGGVTTPEQEPFRDLGFSPNISTIVAGCLRRGRNGEGVEVAMNLSDGTKVVFDETERALITEYVDDGSALNVCRVILEAKNNRITHEEWF